MSLSELYTKQQIDADRLTNQLIAAKFMNTGTTYKTQKPLQADITDSRPFYMVVRLGSNGYQKEDASPSVRYDDEAEARQEAERLARKHANHPRGFAVVKAIAIVRGEVSIVGFNLNDNGIDMEGYIPHIPTPFI